MIPVTNSTPVLLAIDPVDFRKQFDGLLAHCRLQLNTNPMIQTGTLFVFINRSKTMIRVLAHDGDGLWLITRRLSNGRFAGWPSRGKPLSTLSAKTLMSIIRSSHSSLVDNKKL